jgi:hypothetical protein
MIKKILTALVILPVGALLMLIWIISLILVNATEGALAWLLVHPVETLQNLRRGFGP